MEGDADFIDTRSADNADAQLKCGHKETSWQMREFRTRFSEAYVELFNNEIIEYNLHYRWIMMKLRRIARFTTYNWVWFTYIWFVFPLTVLYFSPFYHKLTWNPRYLNERFNEVLSSSSSRYGPTLHPSISFSPITLA